MLFCFPLSEALSYPLCDNLTRALNPKQKNATFRWHYTRDYFYLLEMLFKV